MEGRDALLPRVAQRRPVGADELGRRNPLFAGLGELFEPLRTQGSPALAFGGVALHPGALAAYRDAGLLAEQAAE